MDQDSDIKRYTIGFFIGLSLLNVFDNGWMYKRARISLNLTQLIASNLQLLNTIMFAAELSTPVDKLIGDCYSLSTVASVIFFSFLTLSSYVLIIRATVLLPVHYRNNIRIALLILLASSAVTNIISNVLRQIVIGETCATLFDKKWNTIGKSIFLVLQISLFCIFGISARAAITRMNKTWLSNLMESVLLRILLCIIAILITVILPLTGFDFGKW
jgi:hypothetical protein